jgi:hypothetical protein
MAWALDQREATLDVMPGHQSTAEGQPTATDGTLPVVGSITKRSVAWFDLTRGLPATWAVLKRHLGVWGALRAFAAVAVTGVFSDPLKSIPLDEKFSAHNETLSRHQFGQTALLDDYLRTITTPARALTIISEVVSTAGAEFIDHNIPLPARDEWTNATPDERRRFAEKVVARFFNAHVEDLETTGQSISFNVKACRFAELSAHGRPHLAPLFCEADSRFCDRQDTPELERNQTLAAGGNCCAFRFHWPDENAQ